MSEPIVYALKTCDTCRKALAALRAAGHEPAVVDVRDDGVPRPVLDHLVAELGPEALINRRSTTWRGLSEDEQARAMEAATTAGVLAEHPTLMKRPVIVEAETVHVGWTPSVRAALGA